MTERKGIVLVVALLCIVAVEVTAIGLYYITMQELRTADSARRDTELRLAARSAVARVMRTWPADSVAALPVSATLQVHDASAQTNGIVTNVSIERLSATLLVIRSYATSSFRESSGIGALVAVTSPEQLAESIADAVVSSSPVVALNGSRVAGATAVADSGSHRPIGTLDFDRVAVIASQRNNGVHYLKGPAVVDSISGNGVWVFDGDVQINGGTLNGVIVARGNLTINGASIDGAIIAPDADVTLNASTVRHDPAAILNAFSAPTLLGPYRPKGRTWIPLF